MADGCFWVQVDTADNNKVVGHSCFGDPADRTLLNDGAFEVRPDTVAGLEGAPPEDLYADPPFDMTPAYRWNDTTNQLEVLV